MHCAVRVAFITIARRVKNVVRERMGLTSCYSFINNNASEAEPKSEKSERNP